MSNTGNVSVSDESKIIGTVVGTNTGQISNTTNVTHRYEHAPLPPIDLAAAHERFAALPTDTVSSVASLPAKSRMPFARNPLFVGRTDELLQLAAIIKSGGTAAIGQVAAATGLGGIGKTQLASEFVHRYGQYFLGGVFWLSFASASSVVAEIAACGGPEAMNFSDFNALKLDDQVARVVQEWQSSVPRLLVFDNCEDEELLARWRPKTGGCRVLVTSRRAQWEPTLGVVALALETLSRAESIALLQKFRPDFSVDTSQLDAIAEALGDLPLALHLAGSFLARYGDTISPKQYLAQLLSQNLLEHRSLQGTHLRSPLSPTGHMLHVARTFALSYEKLDSVDAIDSLSVTLLTRIAYLAPGLPITRELVHAIVAPLGDSTDIIDAVLRLAELGLITFVTDNIYSLHRLLGTFIRSATIDPSAHNAVEDAIIRYATALNEAAAPSPLSDFLPHLRHITDTALLRNDATAALLCQEYAHSLWLLQDYSAARIYTEHSLHIRQTVFPVNSVELARSLNDMGVVLLEAGDFDRARSYFEQALVMRRSVLGNHHTDVAVTLNNIGTLLKEQGDLPQAYEYIEAALLINRELQGERSTNTMRMIHNLGDILKELGDFPGARAYYEQAFALRQEAFGNHRETALSLYGLGTILEAQGDLASAGACYQQTVKMARTVFGNQNSQLVEYLTALGLLLGKFGKIADAEEALQEALNINYVLRGDSDPSTASSLEKLAAVYVAQRKWRNAYELLKQVLDIRVAVLDPEDSELRLARENLFTIEKQLYPYSRSASSSRATAQKQISNTTHQSKPNNNPKRRKHRR